MQQKNQEKPRQRANDANRPQQGGYQQRTIPQGSRTDKPQQQRGDSRARGRTQGRRAERTASASRSSSAMTGRSRASGANAPCRPQAN